MIPSLAQAQSIKLETQSDEIYANMPFQLSIILNDFDSTPQPELDGFEIENADVRFLGVSPRTSSSTTIINGRVSSHTETVYIFTYQITPNAEGNYMIPEFTARQGGKEAKSQAVTFRANSVQLTDDMRLELKLPTGKIWVGQTFEVMVDWYVAKEVNNHTLNLPILDMGDTFEVEEPEDNGNRMRMIPLMVGSRQIGFPYTGESVRIKGVEYTRFRIPIDLTAHKPGTITIPASKVIAGLQTGVTRDGWGFRQPKYQFFRAEDIVRTLTIQDLPLASRPATFSNAMGEDYEIQVKPDRTIVKVGDPIVLTIDISSPSSMDGLILPSLNDAGLNEQLFSVPNDDPIGENIDGGQGRHIRRFTVPVRIKSERVKEIPPIAFSYFNPDKEQFATVRSQPVALSVTAVDRISVNDIVSAQKPADSKASQPTQQTDSANSAKQPEPVNPTSASLDLGITTRASDLDSPIKQYNTRPVRMGIYVLPFIVLGALMLIRRVRRSRQSHAPQRNAAQALADVMKKASGMEAKEASSALSNALNELLSTTDTPHGPFLEICEKIDAEAYRPDAKSLPDSLIDELRDTVKKHINPSFSKIISSIFIVLLAIVMISVPDDGFAQDGQTNPVIAGGFDHDVRTIGIQMTPDATASLQNATDAYYKAMSAQDRTERIANFKRSASLFEALGHDYPQIASLQTDAGNAFLGAADFGRASLAYHRALAIDPRITQASNNLAYVRSVIGDTSTNDQNTITSAFLLSQSMTRDFRLFLAAIMFAVGVLLLIPWSGKHRRLLSFLAVIPLIVWVWLLAGAYMQPRNEDAVLMTESFLKSADNVGSPNVSATPIEPGYAVFVLESRDGWVQIETSNGSKGWVNASAIEYIRK